MTALLALAALLAPPTDAARLVDDLAALRFDRLGHPAVRWDALPPVQAPADDPHRLLVVLVDFPDRRFDRFADAPDQGQKLAAWYQAQLFDPDYRRHGTLSHYYRDQSMGLYHMQGRVLPPVTLPKPRAAYGAPTRPAGGDWRSDADAEGMVVDALKGLIAAHPELDLGPFDRWDPHDMDGDGLRAEADGYLDHFVLVYAGGGQASCHGLYHLGRVFTPDAQPDVVDTLDEKARRCAERLWPHRFVVQRGEGQGPVVEGRRFPRGGVELRPGLWVRDYNMQSEYIDRSTFAHEFAHGLGLPDVYARSTSNSTGPWSVMSATRDPDPQNLTAWSRIQLGWLQPAIVRPPGFGGQPLRSIYLRRLDDPVDPPDRARALQAAGVWRAALVILPPKRRIIELAPPPGGENGLYSGQGNDLNRSAELRLDLTGASKSVRLAFDGWWQIEAGWDFAYLETSVDGGRTWTRRLPTDRRVMPARHGHDGPGSRPGFTGVSGDLDGDGRNESHPKCDPKAKRKHGEDRVGAGEDPCAASTWVPVAFDLDDLAGKEARIRLRYVTDMAAVQRGIFIDRVRLDVDGAARLRESFEAALNPEWRLDGFLAGPGRHVLAVPHYYVIEYRDPYAADAGYDRALADNSLRFYQTPGDPEGLRAVRVRPRPGVLAWYVDGGVSWSENDPADLGPGRGFLLAVDAVPNELPLPGLEALYRGDPAAFDTRYEVKDEAAQSTLEQAWRATLCGVRGAAWRPRDLKCDREASALDGLLDGDRPLLFGYARGNAWLPVDRERFAPAGELIDHRPVGQPRYRLRDRSLRYIHTLDAPFALTPFPDGVEHFRIRDGALVKVGAAPHPAVTRFADADRRRWQNPHLPFGGVAVPPVGFGFELTAPKPSAPAPARVKLWLTFDR